MKKNEKRTHSNQYMPSMSISMWGQISQKWPKSWSGQLWPVLSNMWFHLRSAPPHHKIQARQCIYHVHQVSMQCLLSERYWLARSAFAAWQFIRCLSGTAWQVPQIKPRSNTLTFPAAMFVCSVSTSLLIWVLITTSLASVWAATTDLANFDVSDSRWTPTRWLHSSMLLWIHGLTTATLLLLVHQGQ